MSFNPILRSNPGGFRAVGSTGNSRTTPRWDRAEWASASRLNVPPDAVPDTTDDLEATGVDTGAPSVGSPALTQAHALTATGVATSAPSVGAPALTQAHALTAAGIATSAPTTGTPALGVVVALAAVDVATGAPTVEAPTLTVEGEPAAEPEKSAAGDNRRRRRGKPGRTWTLAEWQEEQRRKRLPPPTGELADVTPPAAPQPIPDPPAVAVPLGELAGVVPPAFDWQATARAAAALAEQAEEEDLELLLLA